MTSKADAAKTTSSPSSDRKWLIFRKAKFFFFCVLSTKMAEGKTTEKFSSLKVNWWCVFEF